MNLLYLKKFNNYYNRRVKYFDDLQSYIDNSDGYFFNPAVDFNPNDGVSTVKVANLDGLEFNPDYLLVLTEDNDKDIVSRWFVVEMKRLRNGQYNITLRRDVIADHYDSLLTAPIFVHKGNVRADNPLIFNKEGINFNQIKTSEIALKDRTNTAWIVGYLGNDALTEDKTITFVPSSDAVNIASLPIKLADSSDPSAGGTVSTLSYSYIKTGFNIGGYTNNLRVNRCRWQTGIGPYIPEFGGIDLYMRGEAFVRVATYDAPSYSEIGTVFWNTIERLKISTNLAMDTLFTGRGELVATKEELEEIKQLNGQLVYSDITGKHYRVTIGASNTDINPIIDEFGPEHLEEYQNPLYGVLNATTVDICNTYPDGCSIQTPNAAGYCYQVEYKMNRLNIILNEEITGQELTTTLSAGHNKLNDAPYSMFAMPFNLENLALATKISIELSTYVYDIQILPYCPALELLTENNEIIAGADEGVDYDKILYENEIFSYILWAKTSSGTFNIYTSINLNLADPIEIKLSNECDLYRIVSPNYNGAFEFSVAKNLGVEYFEVSYTYKPYSPYIQVNPAFNNLYGTDFNDARGLICNGNFSIATLTDQWKTYEINNKNYENIFNAQIKTMDKNNALNLTSQSIANPLNAISSGVGIGALANPAAGLAAGTASFIGGIADIAIGQSMYQNNRQLQKDMFAMNLQNIQARPDTLNKISAYNINNKYFPFVEYYTCTDVEKEAFRNKLKYEGMTLGIISTINSFINYDSQYNFFKGSPIILEDIAEDYHIADAIAVELEKGVYL